MKRIFIGVLFALTVAGSVRATDLQIGSLGNCYSNFPGNVGGYTGSESFSLPDLAGTGTLTSGFTTVARQATNFYNRFFYQVDLSGIQPGSHCVSVRVYFGTPLACDGNQIEDVPENGAPVSSATETFLGVTVQFGTASSPCLSPGQISDLFTMVSDQNISYGYVTIIDDYTDALTGTNKEVQIKVRAIVPDVPESYLSPFPPLYQGVLKRNDTGPTNAPAPLNGRYDLGLQLYNAPSNGLPIGPQLTQSVTVSNGLFNAPLNFDPSVFYGGQRWLSISVSPAGSNTFTALNPPQPISPAPQAIYAYTAGSVADLAPGQAVTSLNGLTDPVNLQAGSGIVLGTNGNTLIVSTIPGAISDRNLKTDFAAINPSEVLARLAALPVQSWRYTNELAQVRHIGPMAQDFMQTFRLGENDKIIGYVDENGVALAAIQGLYRKLEAQKAENTVLKARLDKLENLVTEKK